MLREDFRCGLSGLPEKTFGNRMLGCKNEGATFSGQTSFAITPARSLRDGIDAGQSAVNGGKVNIDSGFDELGRNDPAWQALLQPGSDRVEAGGPVLRAYTGAEMEVGFGFPKEPVETGGVSLGIHDA